jgi:hypothetical protein
MRGAIGSGSGRRIGAGAGPPAATIRGSTGCGAGAIVSRGRAAMLPAKKERRITHANQAPRK